MESPLSFSTHSEPQLISEDSGLLITSGSFSSDSASGWPLINSEIQESDYDDKSLSLCESLETTERMCTDNFNTVKKGAPHKVVITTIDPPPEFQDSPPTSITRSNSAECISSLVSKLDTVTLEVPSARTVSPMYGRSLRYDSTCEWRQCFHQRFASPRILHRSPCHANRPASRNSLTSRLSSSHNSLTTQLQTDDSTFITQAISHDTLSTTGRPVITDMYNVPFDSEFYAIPIDSIKPGRHKLKKDLRAHRKHYRNGCISSPVNIVSSRPCHFPVPIKPIPIQDGNIKRHSLPGTSFSNSNYQSSRDARQMTLREVRNYLNTLYSSSSESESKNYAVRTNKSIQTPNTISRQTSTELIPTVLKGSIENNNNNTKKSKNSFTLNAKIKKDKEYNKEDPSNNKISKPSKHKQSPVKFLTFNLKQTFCNLFRFKRSPSSDGCNQDELIKHPPSLVRRALPPLPKTPRSSVRKNEDETVNDFATSIEKVKDYGWYWGPLSVEAAEKILSNEPDGSFIVRDSSDDHYIFSLTFKLHGMRHVRIEHEQGNFSFGGCTMFKAQTIVEFIENAVETSRSGRYLFFLNLRPALGPVRVQLLYPVSRFKRVQSLQHMCRFVILKTVRRDLVSKLPLPRRLLDYLSVAHYYSELQLDN